MDGSGEGIASGGGPPHGSGMEAQVARLEDQFGRIKGLLRGIDERLRKFEVDAGEMRGRLSSLPDTWAMATTVIGGQMALAGLLFGALKLGGSTKGHRSGYKPGASRRSDSACRPLSNSGCNAALTARERATRD